MTKRIFCLLVMVLFCLSSLTGCYNSLDSEYIESDYQEDTQDYSYQEEKEYQTVPQEILNTKFKLSNSQIKSLKDTIKHIEVNYEKSEYFDLENALKSYNKIELSPVPKSRDIIKNNKINCDDLLNYVTKNNSVYFKNCDNTYYTKVPDEVIEKTVSIITNAINFNLENNKYINLDALDYNLKNIKILEYNEFGYAFYSQSENVMALNIEAINNVFKNNENSFEDIITHESNHIVQSAIIKLHDELETNFGMCYQFKNMQANYLYWVWFIEAAAQNNVLLQLNTTPEQSSSYESFVNALNSIISTYAFNNKNVYELQHTTAQKDIDKLYDVLNCETQAEKDELLKMMVSYTLYIDSTDIILSSHFYEKAKVDDDYTFKKKLRCSIGQTLSKMFYKNLANKLKNNQIKLEDLFSLIAVFETRMAKEVWYNSTEQNAYMNDFYNNYTAIQNAFFKEISKASNISFEKLIEYYTNYYHTANLDKFNNQMLTKAQNEFYQKTFSQCSQNRENTVMEAKEILGK